MSNLYSTRRQYVRNNDVKLSRYVTVSFSKNAKAPSGGWDDLPVKGWVEDLEWDCDGQNEHTVI